MEKFITYIKPPKGFTLGLKELWQYRELFYFFTWRDIKVKYKQTSLGIVWALLQPLGMMLLFTLLFSKTWKIDTGTISYPIFVLSGLILWNLFNTSVSHAAESMIVNGNIIKKIYFPRLIIPGSSVLVALFDFMMGLIIFLVFCFIYRQAIQWTAVIYYTTGIIMLITAAFGLGAFLAALNVKYRDFRYAIPFLLQILFFSSQIIYPLRSIENLYLKYILAINPVNATIELFRGSFFNTGIDNYVILIGAGSSLSLFFIGIYYFRKTEIYFADLV